MEKEKLESLLIDYIDGRLGPDDKALVEAELQKPEVQLLRAQLQQVLKAMDESEELQPKSRMKQQFEAMLKAEMDSQRKAAEGGRQVFFNPVVLRAAAGVVLVMVGIGIGYWINQTQQQQKELAEIKREMEATKSMMMAMLDNQQSASQRLVGVSVAYKMEQADDEIVTALVKTMNEDGNTNVRLAALEALGKFQRLPHVRQALIEALGKQTDPVVQIELIRILVDMKGKEVIDELQKITTDEQALPAVKDEAHAGIMKLS